MPTLFNYLFNFFCAWLVLDFALVTVSCAFMPALFRPGTNFIAFFFFMTCQVIHICFIEMTEFLAAVSTRHSDGASLLASTFRTIFKIIWVLYFGEL